MVLPVPGSACVLGKVPSVVASFVVTGAFVGCVVVPWDIVVVGGSDTV